MIIGIGYGVVGLIVAGIGARRALWSARSSFGYAEAADYFLSLLAGVMMGALWPLTVVGVGASWLLRRDMERNHPEAVAARQRERQRELDERQREIERLERELGVGS